MAILDVEFRSEAVGHDVSYTLLLPERGDTPYPVLIQLHGLGDNHRSWLRKSMLAMHVRDYPLAVAMPATYTGSYLNWKSNNRLNRQHYEDLIVKDLVAHLRRHFSVSGGPWAIGGLSMGGYGSMRLGLKYPDMFSSVWAHSSAFHIPDNLDPTLFEEGQLDDASVFVLAERLKGSGKTPPAIAFDCGVDDQLIGYNRDFAAHLTRLDIDHHYAEHPGAHTWDYWDTHVPTALEQHARVLGIARIEPD